MTNKRYFILAILIKKIQFGLISRFAATSFFSAAKKRKQTCLRAALRQAGNAAADIKIAKI